MRYPKTAGSRKCDFHYPAEVSEINIDYFPFLGIRASLREKDFFIQIYTEVKQKMPSNKILEQKQEMVAALAEKMKNAVSGVLVKYEGIKVEDDTKLRAELRKAGVDYTVMKNTLTGRACEIAGYDAMKEHLTGMTAIALGTTDPIAPAKILKSYADKIDSFEIKAGFIDGGVIDANGVNELASIPSKEVLIAKVLGSLLSPLYGLAYVLQAKIDKEGESAPAEA